MAKHSETEQDRVRARLRQLPWQQRLKNWWDYNKVYVLLVVLILAALIYMYAGSANAVEPDYQVGLVTSVQREEEELGRLEERLVPYGKDRNADGEVVVSVVPYYAQLGAEDGGANYMVIAALDADLVGCESGLFLLEDPEAFQEATGMLLYLDGTVPEEGAEDYENMAHHWEEKITPLYIACRRDDGENSQYIADSQELLQNLLQSLEE
ncbi:MAG: hypothetical protein IJX71_04755 [Oscillospiraceae bacterium]|nr:hypothetical protein [Oscillospiraceae bacterium]